MTQSFHVTTFMLERFLIAAMSANSSEVFDEGTLKLLSWLRIILMPREAVPWSPDPI